MKTLYFNCFSGVSGDMCLGALTHSFVPRDYLISELKKLDQEGDIISKEWNIDFRDCMKNGITANYANVQIVENHEYDYGGHRSYADIIALIDKSGIADGAKKIAKDIFITIAEAESKVHGQPVSDVCFHEVGAADSIIDIVGTAICIDYIKPDKIFSSPINDGSGFTECQHGLIPVPVPAVMEIVAAKKVKLNQLDIQSELVTPTGAAIIATLATGYYLPENITITQTGYGAGKKDFEIPNVLRVCLCEEEPRESEKVTVIQTNIDDQTPETLAFALERLLEAGARDVFFTPIQMKKNRPAVLLTVVCSKQKIQIMTDIIFKNTSTIGLRMREESRICLEREFSKVTTKYGEVDVKISHYNGIKKVMPEYESARKISIENKIPIDEIYRSVYNSI